MTAAGLLGADRLLVVLVAGLWGAAGGYTLAARTAPRLAFPAGSLIAAALAATAARAVVAGLLAGHSWWFAGEKLLLSLPLLAFPALTTTLTTLPALYSAGRGTAGPGALRPALVVPVLSAAYAAVAGVVISVALGFPGSPYLAAVIVLAWAAGTWATWSMMTHKGPKGRAWRVAGSVLAVLALCWTGLSLWNTRPADAMNLAPTGTTAITDLTGPTSKDAKKFTLTAQPGPNGTLTFNGTTPGPTIRVTQGDDVEVTLRNTLPDRGVTLHWHGYHVPNAEDGVPGLTQNAVQRGGTFVYRFTATQPGTYWYHTHQTPNTGLQRGLFGAFIVDATPPTGMDEPVTLHTFNGALTLQALRTPPPGTAVRLRVINTDNGPHVLGLSGAPYRIAAVDGMSVTGRTLTNERAQLAAGGRYDLTFTMPRGPVLLTADAATLNLGQGGKPADGDLIDITRYGERQVQPPARFDRDYTWVLDRLVTPRDGLPLLSHTVNGEVWPRIPAPVVREGEWVRFTVVNRGGDLHPMHPHGHHVLVLSRNGVAAAPLWMDSFDVGPGEVWVVALKADNPGVWLAHCHELKHAVEGMTLHFAYEGIRSPYTLGHANHPE
ncbi:multicopper oxidase domain-containing protein [Nonomuraea sp. NPDC050556]|uniref:multicopper oxidase domain-containing protein n=1 Tax=Nonomuraea sp. NPDC050556 TaxID=3364369 RepID=UPI0037AD753D